MWRIWGSDDKIPKAMFYLLKGCSILDRASCVRAGREYVFSELRGVWARDLTEGNGERIVLSIRRSSSCSLGGGRPLCAGLPWVRLG